ncbi:type II secretion system F family protein [Kineococcus sp. SYSU DK003]|uniref:type II secretion system F family protein n=1 Tax=Kineococcus sp. SYSU DK003 TaxID=3383124 RepID=UPI003D7D7E3C
MNPDGPAGPLLVAALLAAAVLAATRRGGDPRADGPRSPRSVVRRYARAVRRRDRTGASPPDVALVCDLVAAAVGAGLPPGRALEAALDALAGEGYAEDAALRRAAARLSWGGDPAEAAQALADGSAPWADLAEPLLLSARTGAPAATLLTSAAASVRARRRWSAEAAAARLSASLVLPLGLCTLPAFLLLGVVPVVLSLAAEVFG